MDCDLRFFIIVVSSGRRAAITTFLKNIPKSINAAFAVVVHSSFDAPSIFAKILSQKVKLEVQESSDSQKISSGQVYIFKPDHHLFVEEGDVRLSTGPRENLFRPAIDVLFQSATIAFENRCVGILMTGRLNDGTAGLGAIKRCGGLTVIQNPATAEYSDMPATAQQMVDIDCVVNLEDRAAVIAKIVGEPLPIPKEIPKSLIRENEIAMRTLEEKKMLLQRITTDYSGKGMNSLAASFKNKIEEVSTHISKLRTVLKLHD